MERTTYRNISFITLALIIVLLVATTFIEKYYGTEVTREHVYYSPLFVALWMILTMSAIAYIINVSRRFTLIMLHISLAVVLSGAFISFLTSQRGTILLHMGAAPASIYTTDDNRFEKLPFRMTLANVDTCHSNAGAYYADVAVETVDNRNTMRVTLNNPIRIKGYSLCISSISDEHLSLLVSYDHYGLPISYTGYLMTLIFFIAILFDRKSHWRSLLKRIGKKENTKKNDYNGLKRRSATLVLALTILGIIRWYDTGLFPVTNGKECMLFFIWISFLLAVIATYRKELQPIASTFFVLGGIAVFTVPFMWNSDGGEVAPILRTPLLGIHVTTIIIAYVLLGCTAINASVALFFGLALKKEEKMERFATIGRILLYPATLLLMTGIFIGAVWANISWGRYWGWDPKEVWALITLLTCSLLFHTRSLPFMAKALNFHIFSLLAFLTMLFTFFGVNYLFGGLHSYM